MSEVKHNGQADVRAKAIYRVTMKGSLVNALLLVL